MPNLQKNVNRYFLTILGETLKVEARNLGEILEKNFTDIFGNIHR